MSDKETVTLTYENYVCDYELPVLIPLSELYPRLLSVLKHDAPKVFGDWKQLLLGIDAGACSELSATLSQYGVSSGEILTIIREV